MSQMTLTLMVRGETKFGFEVKGIHLKFQKNDVRYFKFFFTLVLPRYISKHLSS